MGRLDSEAKRTSSSILHSLLENAAAKTSTERQIHTDEPAEAPKEEKEALIKRTQKPEVPHKEHIVEGEDIEECVANRTITAELNEEADDFDKEKDVKTELENQIASLQDALNNTPEMPEDERAEIQAQIDELLDEINYYENEGMFESSLRESENDYTHEELELWVSELSGLSATEAYEKVMEETGNPELADDVAAQIEMMHDEAGIFDESEKLEEKVNKDNVDINRAIANPNLGKNKDKIKAAGYETSEYDNGNVYAIRNPKTGKGVVPSNYDKEGKAKVDFKGKLDSERPENRKANVYSSYAGKGKQIPSRAIVGKDKHGNAVVDYDEYDAYSSHASGATNYKDDYKSISKNINDYKQAIKDREEGKRSAENNKSSVEYYEKQLEDIRKRLEFEKEYMEKKLQQSKAAEERRQEIIAKRREARNK